MNKLFIFILITSFILTQNKSVPDVLNQIQERSKSIKKKSNPNLENKFSQAKTLERSGLYEEALLLYKEINQSNPGISKYYLPLKNYLKQTESWDSLLVYTQMFSNARNNDLQSKLEFLDVYIFMDSDDKWKPLAITLMLDLSTSEISIRKIIQQLLSSGEFDFIYSLLSKYRNQTGCRTPTSHHEFWRYRACILPLSFPSANPSYNKSV